MQQIRRMVTALMFSFIMPTALWAQGVLEVPLPPHSVQSGAGFISGWYCNLPETDILTVRFNGGSPIHVLYGASREDTRTVCGGTANNGYVMPWNWNILGDGLHTVEVFAGDVLFDSAEVWVTTFGVEFLSGVDATCIVEDFPQAGQNTMLGWQENSQNFVIESVDTGDGSDFAGLWEGATSQGLPFALTVNDANVITQLEFTYQQLGEIPPDPSCQPLISIALSTPVLADGTFNVELNVSDEANLSTNTDLLTFEGTLSGALGNSQGIGEWNFSQALLFCQRNPSQSATNGCGSELFPCDGFDFSYDVSRVE